jgi:hypothetical protein
VRRTVNITRIDMGVIPHRKRSVWDLMVAGYFGALVALVAWAVPVLIRITGGAR